MAESSTITIPLDMPREEACAFAELLKRTSYDDCLRRSNRRKQYSDGREEADVMWAALRLVENQFAEAGFSPRQGGTDACPHPSGSSRGVADHHFRNGDARRHRA